MRRFLLKVAICSPVLGAIATPVLFDGMLSKEYTLQDLDTSTGPYLSVVKGTQNASHYTTLSHTQSTRLWNADDVAFAVSIDNSSVFTPGSSTPQFGFRRTDLIAQPSEAGANRTAFNNDVLETGTTAFHFSVLVDSSHPLNISHEYQLIYIEPNDGSHVFDLQTGTPFNTTVTTESHDLRIRSHNGTVLFHTPFLPDAWHNFAIVVDWTTLTLQTFYSMDGARLKEVSPVTANIGAVSGPNGKGDFHVALLKLPLIDPLDTPAEQADVVHFGIQEGTKESLIYSGVFVESIRDGLSGC